MGTLNEALQAFLDMEVTWWGILRHHGYCGFLCLSL